MGLFHITAKRKRGNDSHYRQGRANSQSLLCSNSFFTTSRRNDCHCQSDCPKTAITRNFHITMLSASLPVYSQPLPASKVIAQRLQSLYPPTSLCYPHHWPSIHNHSGRPLPIKCQPSNILRLFPFYLHSAFWSYFRHHRHLFVIVCAAITALSCCYTHVTIHTYKYINSRRRFSRRVNREQSASTINSRRETVFLSSFIYHSQGHSELVGSTRHC